LPDDPADLSVLATLRRFAEEAKYLDVLMEVHRHDLEEVLTAEEWQIMQESMRRFWISYESIANGETQNEEAVCQVMIDAATIAELDGFINGLVYCSVRELNLSRTGPKASKLEFIRARGSNDSVQPNNAIAPEASGVAG
jgi:hypothetical protein